jgi:signal transduction histidine kinase
VELWARWRADLRRPEAPVHPDERSIHLVAPAVIAVIAQLTDPGTAGELLLLVPAVLVFPLWARLRWFPAEAFVAVVLASVGAAIGHQGNLEAAFFLVATAVVYASWTLGSLTRTVLVVVVACVVEWWVAEHATPAEGIVWTPWAVANVFSCVLGRALRRQGQLIEQLEETRRELADSAVAEERRRIARELHDLAGHTLAAMLLHVTGARHLLRRDLDEAERALRDAEAVGRSSLDQIRATVAGLREDERGTDPALPAAGDLEPLVDDYRRAGLDVTYEADAAAAALDGPVGTALHRIAREALSNVARHAPGNRVTVRLVEVDDIVRLTVRDRGTAGRPPPPASGAHFGLVGMAERARALGGEMSAGPAADGWRVDVRLPVRRHPEGIRS